MSPGPPPGLWRNATFLRLWAAQTVTLTGSAVTKVALPLVAVTILNLTPQQMGLLMAVEIAPTLLLRLPAAAWADASSRQVPVLVACSMTSSLLIASIPLLWWMGLLSFGLLLGMAFCLTSVSAIGGMFAAPILPAVVGDGQLVEANGRFSVTRNLADVSGRSLGGLLVSVLSAPVALLVDAASFAVAALLTVAVRVPRKPQHVPARNTASLKGLTLGFSLLLQRPFLGLGLVIVGYLCLANGVVSALLVLFMSGDLGMSPSLIGPIVGVGSVGGIVASLLVGTFHRRLGAQWTVAVAVALLTGSFALLPLARPGALGLVACLNYELMGSFGASLLLITLFAEVPRQVPSNALARVMAVISLMPEVSTMLGALLGGTLGTSLGIPRAFAVSFAFALLSGTALALGLAWRRRLLLKRQAMVGG
ncbi:MFS transporter [Myxococcus sp. CA056]|uniref:MFS transporter n=1 Tax=unclassified Myxococcus TaxID=2648731 RepID=UPI00157A39D3|nr:MULTISPECIES: MFS transporter [unclassified Myxococcus]NTX13027.1 MFS transporter [Myxococcus sp. CA056]NTX57751.1 MFS transporter [Myxococcus sp. CA039A]